MTTTFQPPIGRAGLPAEPAELSAEREDDRAADAWALAITQVLVDARPRLTLPGAPEAPAGASTPAHGRPASAEPGTALGASGGGASSTGSAGSGQIGSGQIGSGQSGAAGSGAAHDPQLPTKIITEISDSRLGRMELSVARGEHGLHIVINVADAHVKALIEADQASLLKSLQGCGLSVDSVKIGSSSVSGTGLAPQEVAQERALVRGRGNHNLRPANARWRGYGAPSEEDPEEHGERVNLEA